MAKGGIGNGSALFHLPEPLLRFRHIVSSDRQRVTVADILDLIIDHAAVAEGNDDAGQIELPHAEEAFVIERDDRIALLGDAAAPMLARIAVMAAPRPDTGDDELWPLARPTHLRPGRDVTPRQ